MKPLKLKKLIQWNNLLEAGKFTQYWAMLNRRLVNVKSQTQLHHFINIV
jgi:hypothetical protein